MNILIILLVIQTTLGFMYIFDGKQFKDFRSLNIIEFVLTLPAYTLAYILVFPFVAVLLVLYFLFFTVPKSRIVQSLLQYKPFEKR